MKLAILANMNRRERMMVIGGGGLAALILAWAWIIDPSVKGRAELALKIEAKKQELAEVKDVVRRLAAARGKFGALETRLADADGQSPLSLVESAGRASGIMDNIISMEPQPQAETEGFKESSVALKIEKIPLAGLVEFIKTLGTQKIYIRVKRASIKPLYENPELLDAALTLSWYQRR